MNSTKSYDVVICGAGIIGLSIAWQLARRCALRIAVIDKGAGVGEGSTGASSAVCRYRYSRTQVLELARDGIHAYRHWREFTGLAEPRAAFQNDGVLWMPGADPDWSRVECERLRAAGIGAEVLDDDELARRFPAINPCTQPSNLETGEDHPFAGGGLHLLETEAGYMDPVFAAEDLLEACRGAGVEILFRRKVTGVATTSGRVTGVQLDDGSRIATGHFVSAAGPWCGELLARAGLSLPWNLVPTRIQMLYLDRPAEVEGHIPVSVDMVNGIYYRTQNRGQQIIVGSVLEEDEREAVGDPDNFDTQPDEAFRARILHLLHHRIPSLPYRGKVRGYCGLYTVNRNDVHPLLGPSEIEGLWLANGFSGHGFKLAPAIGSLMAQALSGERTGDDSAVDIGFFAVDREPIPVDSLSVLA